MKPTRRRKPDHDVATCTEWETSCHRVRAAIRERHSVGESVESLALDYELTVAQVLHILERKG